LLHQHWPPLKKKSTCRYEYLEQRGDNRFHASGGDDVE
jgi:hypothetical protein